MSFETRWLEIGFGEEKRALLTHAHCCQALVQAGDREQVWMWVASAGVGVTKSGSAPSIEAAKQGAEAFMMERCQCRECKSGTDE